MQQISATRTSKKHQSRRCQPERLPHIEHEHMNAHVILPLSFRSRPPWAPWPPWSQWEEVSSAHTGTEEETGPGSRGSSSAPHGRGLHPPYPGPAWPGSPPAPGCYGHRWMGDSGKPKGQREEGEELDWNASSELVLSFSCIWCRDLLTVMYL